MRWEVGSGFEEQAVGQGVVIKKLAHMFVIHGDIWMGSSGTGIINRRIMKGGLVCPFLSLLAYCFLIVECLISFG